MLRRPETAEGLTRFREHGPSELRFGSGCSGSGQDREVADTVSGVLQSLGCGTTFKHSFLTEANGRKQKWLLETAKLNPHQLCLFFRMEASKLDVQLPAVQDTVPSRQRRRLLRRRFLLSFIH